MQLIDVCSVYTEQVSDFGLSRVEDDDSCATFPFNSCGTAAYVAPEALITTKKVRPGFDLCAVLCSLCFLAAYVHVVDLLLRVGC